MMSLLFKRVENRKNFYLLNQQISLKKPRRLKRRAGILVKGSICIDFLTLNILTFMK